MYYGLQPVWLIACSQLTILRPLESEQKANVYESENRTLLDYPVGEIAPDAPETEGATAVPLVYGTLTR
jgi:hypothetical protein